MTNLEKYQSLKDEAEKVFQELKSCGLLYGDDYDSFHAMNLFTKLKDLDDDLTLLMVEMYNKES